MGVVWPDYLTSDYFKWIFSEKSKGLIWSLSGIPDVYTLIETIILKFIQSRKIYKYSLILAMLDQLPEYVKPKVPLKWENALDKMQAGTQTLTTGSSNMLMIPSVEVGSH